MGKIIKSIYTVLLTIITIAIVSVLFYITYYERHIISNSNQTKHLTIWKKWGGDCYLIKDKYWSVFLPKDNYLKTYNTANLIVVWNPENSNKEVSLYSGNYQEITDGFELYANVYKDRKQFLYDYTGKYYDPSRKMKFNEDSIEYKKKMYEIDYVDIACLSNIFKVIPCIDH